MSIKFKSVDAPDSIKIDEDLYEKIQECCYKVNVELLEGILDFSTSSTVARVIQTNLPNTEELLELVSICECGSIEIEYV